MLQTLLFFHILGVVGLFVGFALEVIILVRLRAAATLAEMSAAMLNVPLIRPLMVSSVLLVLATGISMVYIGSFGWSQGWIDVVLLVLLVLAVLAPVVVGNRLEGLHEAVERSQNGPITAEMDATRRGRAMNYTIFLSLFETLAALYVMVSKPMLTTVVLLLVLAAVAAVVPTAVILRGGNTPGTVSRE